MIRACQFCTTEFQARSFERYCSPKCVVRGRSKRNDAGCWIWQGHLNGDGYGMVGAWRRRGTERAHRFSYKAFKGDIGARAVCHSCDVRACCNPDHLFAATQMDNIADCIAKGRQTRGTKSFTAKLSESQVREIRALNGSARKIAAQYGVSHHCISDIKLRRTWKHVE